MTSLALMPLLALLSPPAIAQIDWDLDGFSTHLAEGSSSSVVTDADVGPDGNVFLCARRTVVFPNPIEAFVEKVDGATGDIIWRRKIEGSATFVAPVDVVAQGDGGVIAVAIGVEAGIEPDSVTIVTRYDTAGAVQWQTRLTRTPPVVGRYSTVSHSATDDGQGGVLIAGFETIPGLHPQRATIFRVDATGQELPSVAPFGNGQPEFYDIERCASGGYLLAMGTFAGNHAAKLDGSFGPLWFTTLSPPNGPVFHRSIVEDELGNVFGVLSGPSPERRAELVRLDPVDGSVLWTTSPLPDSPVATGPSAGRAPRVVAKSGGGVWVSGQVNFEIPGPLLPVSVGFSFARAVEPDGAAKDVWSFTPSGPGFLGINGAVVVQGGPAFLFGSTNSQALGAPPPAQSISSPTVGVLLRLDVRGEVGTPYCTPAFPNSTGVDGQIAAAGSSSAMDNDVVLRATDLPPQVTALFVSGSLQGVTPLLGGSQGVLCIAGNLGRFNDSIGTSSVAGLFRYSMDTQAIPTALGPIAATAGLTLNFQCWHRDTIPGGSNTTNAVSLTFD